LKFQIKLFLRNELFQHSRHLGRD